METYESATEQNQVKKIQHHEFEVEADRLCSFAEDFRRQRNKIRGIWLGRSALDQNSLQQQVQKVDDANVRNAIGTAFSNFDGAAYIMWKRLPKISAVTTREDLSNYINEINSYVDRVEESGKTFSKLGHIAASLYPSDHKTLLALTTFEKKMLDGMEEIKSVLADIQNRLPSTPTTQNHTFYTLSSDYTHVSHMNGEGWGFTPEQAPVIKIVYEEALKGHGFLAKKNVMATAGLKDKKWAQVFRSRQDECKAIFEDLGRMVRLKLK